jgi:hypothetical protein
VPHLAPSAGAAGCGSPGCGAEAAASLPSMTCCGGGVEGGAPGCGAPSGAVVASLPSMAGRATGQEAWHGEKEGAGMVPRCNRKSKAIDSDSEVDRGGPGFYIGWAVACRREAANLCSYASSPRTFFLPDLAGYSVRVSTWRTEA